MINLITLPQNHRLLRVNVIIIINIIIIIIKHPLVGPQQVVGEFTTHAPPFNGIYVSIFRNDKSK